MKIKKSIAIMTFVSSFYSVEGKAQSYSIVESMCAGQTWSGCLGIPERPFCEVEGGTYGGGMGGTWCVTSSSGADMINNANGYTGPGALNAGDMTTGGHAGGEYYCDVNELASCGVY